MSLLPYGILPLGACLLLAACAAPAVGEDPQPAPRAADPAVAAPSNGHRPARATGQGAAAKSRAAKLEARSPAAPGGASAQTTPHPAPRKIDVPPAKAAPPPDPKTEAKAKRLIHRAWGLYTKGDYEHAEELLKEAITLYPFLAEANLLLGKIFLIRGSAGRDRSMINSARLMFEMAHALDANLREAAVLLELFQESTPE